VQIGRFPLLLSNGLQIETESTRDIAVRHSLLLSNLSKTVQLARDNNWLLLDLLVGISLWIRLGIGRIPFRDTHGKHSSRPAEGERK
jgi:hypothetical protein